MPTNPTIDPAFLLVGCLDGYFVLLLVVQPCTTLSELPSPFSVLDSCAMVDLVG
ncbi:expressed unknown protein [Ectocarpus siliculosus]|uniref:Uncharacterized protein n=1 Tax=Ectocarpus siliculosus TaxID=2880 RepID=D7FGR3_ECTSI|nr:expressed unknown protein [Ectocarpus siliculosus]|eukprot:CBJ28339.1 expressed unknown protein [Ectocarpus siliculosus]